MTEEEFRSQDTRKSVDITRPAGLRWRKKPVMIEAVRFLGIVDGTMRFDANPVPDWLTDATGQPEGEEGSIYIGYNASGGVPELRVTDNGPHAVAPGDWIVREPGGLLSPVRPDRFAATYDPADDGDPVMPELASYVGGDGRTHALPSPTAT